MATTPAATSPALGFQPAFKRVEQSNDLDCAFACIAMIANKSIAEVKQAAITQFKFPKHGPFWIDQDLICKLFAHFGYVATIYKEARTIGELPDVAVLMVDYNPDTEIGRHVLFVRHLGSSGRPTVEYILDPAYWIDAAKQTRTDVKGLPASYYIGVNPMKPIK